MFTAIETKVPTIFASEKGANSPVSNCVIPNTSIVFIMRLNAKEAIIRPTAKIHDQLVRFSRPTPMTTVRALITTMIAPIIAIADVNWLDVILVTSSFASMGGSSNIPCSIRPGINVANRTETNMPASNPSVPKINDSQPSTETPKGRLVASCKPKRRSNDLD